MRELKNVNKKNEKRKMYKANSLYHLTIKNIKTMFRDRGHLAWLIGYPLLIIIIFSLAFGFSSSRSDYDLVLFNYDSEDSGVFGNPADYSLLIIDILETNLSDSIEIIGTQDNFTEEEAINLINYEKIDAIIYIPTNFTEDIYFGLEPEINITTVPDQIAETVINSILKQIVDSIIIYHNGVKPAKINSKQMLNTVKITNFDFLAPGFVISGVLVCISQLALHFSEEKNKGTLKRLSTTPVSRSNILFSGMLSQLLVAFCQTIILLVCLLIFGAYFHPNANVLLLIFIPMLFAFTVLGFGTLLASIVKSEQTAGLLAWFIILPLQFLGGLFFYFENPIMKFIPTSYAAHAMRLVMVEGMNSWNAIGQDILVLIGFGVITTLLGIILFQRKTAIL
ncbi:MAG: ABC transporter permease [Candidatus Odinarchaeota archaeon]